MVTWHREIFFFLTMLATLTPILLSHVMLLLPSHFMDVLIKIINKTIYTTVYSKPTDSHSYLHYESNNPIHLKHSIIFSTFLRYKRICSDNRDFIKCSKELTHRFLIKGYPIKIIHKQWQKVFYIRRVNPLN